MEGIINILNLESNMDTLEYYELVPSVSVQEDDRHSFHEYMTFNIYIYLLVLFQLKLLILSRHSNSYEKDPKL